MAPVAGGFSWSRDSPLTPSRSASCGWPWTLAPRGGSSMRARRARRAIRGDRPRSRTRFREPSALDRKHPRIRLEAIDFLDLTRSPLSIRASSVLDSMLFQSPIRRERGTRGEPAGEHDAAESSDER